ncbi:MAG TPA: methyltransferase domain-containing protein [Solirubrobacteraceae bacterium]|nr:methyltransferase domain-containing protein [Solirubrobacteraceae bacterium]
MTPLDPDEFRADSREGWERAAEGWGRAADRVHDWAVGVSATMVDALALQPGDRVLELAAGPGDTGFLAAELILPGGTLICSDGAQAMLEVARARAAAQRISNVEFRQLELEWIDMETASVDAVLCRWGIMLIADPESAAREIRRVLRPGGRTALAVWDEATRNPWATIARRAMIDLGHAEPPDPELPNQFSLAGEGALAELLAAAGFLEVTVGAVALQRRFQSVEDYLAESAQMSPARSSGLAALDEGARAALLERASELAAAFTDDDGSLVLPGSSLVASASA